MPLADRIQPQQKALTPLLCVMSYVVLQAVGVEGPLTVLGPLPGPGSTAGAGSRPVSPLSSIYSGGGSLYDSTSAERTTSPLMVTNNLVSVLC
jgi:hypothetical protein